MTGKTAREEEESRAESAVREFAAAVGMRARLVANDAEFGKYVSIECPGAGNIVAGAVYKANLDIPWTCALADLDGRERPGVKPGCWAKPCAGFRSRLFDIVCSKRPMQVKLLEAAAAGLAN